jgi:CRP-like cAMP-binding protein
MNDTSALSGKLSFISLADLFQLLGGNTGTGVLKITSQYAPNPGYIYFVNGNPINATCGRLKGIDALYPLFGWLDGSFEFHEEEVQKSKVIKQGRMEIVLDALRMFDDGAIKKLGPPSDMFKDETIKKDSLPLIKGAIGDYSYIIGEEEFEDGRPIVKEGKYGKWIWVILEGTVDVERETGNTPMTVLRLGEGSFIGTFTALLFGKYARKSTVIAKGKVSLGLLDTERLSREFNSLSPDFRSLLLSLDTRLKKITDRAVALYTKKGEDMALPKGANVIIGKGSSKHDISIITDGVAYLIGKTQHGDFPLFTLEKEDVIGPLPFLDIGHEPEFAFVAASNDLKLKKLDTGNLQAEYDTLSGLFRSFIYNICACISLTTRVAYHLHSKTKKNNKK